MSLPEVRREAADYEAHPAETLDELKTREDSNSLEFHIYVDHSTPYPGDFSFKVPKNCKYVDLILEIYRQMRINNRDIGLPDYKLIGETFVGWYGENGLFIIGSFFEQPLVSGGSLVVSREIDLKVHSNIVVLATYYRDLEAALHRRYAYYHQPEAMLAYTSVLANFTFLEACEFFGSPDDFANHPIMCAGAVDGTTNLFRKITSIDMFFVPMNSIWGGKTRVKPSEEEGLKSFPSNSFRIIHLMYKSDDQWKILTPNPKLDRVKLVFLNTCIKYIKKYVQKGEESSQLASAIAEFFSIFLYWESLANYPLLAANELLDLVVKYFSIEEIAEILSHFSASTLVYAEFITDEFRTNEAYAKLIGARTPGEIRATMDLITKGRTDVKNPKDLARAVAVLRNPDHYLAMSDLIDLETFYEYVARYTVTEFNTVLSNRQRARIYFLHGRAETEIPHKELKEYFEEYLSNGSNDIFDMYGLTELIGIIDSPVDQRLTPEEIYDYMVRTVGKNSSIFEALFIGTANAMIIFHGSFDDVACHEYMSVFSRVSYGTEIPEESKLLGLREALLSLDETEHDILIYAFYKSIGLTKSLEIWNPNDMKHCPPEAVVDEEGVDEMLKKNPQLLIKIIKAAIGHQSA
jgi:hypothetical protein